MIKTVQFKDNKTKENVYPEISISQALKDSTTSLNDINDKCNKIYDSSYKMNNVYDSSKYMLNSAQLILTNTPDYKTSFKLDTSLHANTRIDITNCYIDISSFANYSAAYNTPYTTLENLLRYMWGYIVNR